MYSVHTLATKHLVIQLGFDIKEVAQDNKIDQKLLLDQNLFNFLLRNDSFFSESGYIHDFIFFRLNIDKHHPDLNYRKIIKILINMDLCESYLPIWVWFQGKLVYEEDQLQPSESNSFPIKLLPKHIYQRS